MTRRHEGQRENRKEVCCRELPGERCRANIQGFIHLSTVRSWVFPVWLCLAAVPAAPTGPKEASPLKIRMEDSLLSLELIPTPDRGGRRRGMSTRDTYRHAGLCPLPLLQNNGVRMALALASLS